MGFIFGRESSESQYVNFAFPLTSYGKRKKMGLMSTAAPPGASHQVQPQSQQLMGLKRGWVRQHLVVRNVNTRKKGLRLY